MKKHRFLFLVGIVGFVFSVMGFLLFMISPSIVSLPGETAVSQANTLPIKQVVMGDGWLTAVSEQLKDAEYAISASDIHMGQQIAYQAPNRAQNLRTFFSETGIQVEPRLVQGDGWNFGLEIVGVNDGMQTVMPETVTHTRDDNRVTMDYGQWQAWYVNDVRGVEQGFTIEAPLFEQETGILQFDMAVTGDLTPQVVNDDEVSLVTAVGEKILSYYGLIAFDAQGSELPAVMDVIALADGQPAIRLSVDVADADYPIIVDPFLGGGIDWAGWINQDANYGFSVSTAGDVNGDGFDDVLVGANWFDAGQQNEGAVFAYYGSPDGLLPVFQWMVEGNEPDMELGYAVNPAGDVNLDGFADVIIGTHMTPTGQAFVYQGTPAGLSNVPLWTGSGKQDGDGFGTAVHTAGDVNNDDIDDIIIGAPYFDSITGGTDVGRAYVFHGPLIPAQQPDWIGEGESTNPGGLFGYSVSTAGDVNQDNFDDVIIGEPLARSEVVQGRAVIFAGSADGLYSPLSGDVTSVFDADWLSDGPYPTVSIIDSKYGASVSAAGDVNGDGFDDVVVGAPRYSEVITDGGAIFVYTGTNPIANMGAFPDPYSSWSATSYVEGAMLGHSVSNAGNVDLDAYDDVIAGAPQYDNEDIIPDNNTVAPTQVGAVNGGGAFVYRGAEFGFNDVWEISSNEANAKLGTSVGTAGDVNGDGYADIIMGAPEMSSPVNTIGTAFSFYGSGVISGLQAFNDSPTSLGQPTLLWSDSNVGGVLGYEWNLGDGALYNGQKIEYVYPQPGYYTAIVTATSLTDQMTATTAVTISASSLINPNTGGSFKFVDETTGFGTGLDIPASAVSDTFKLTYTPLTTITQPSPTNSIGYYFDFDTGIPDHQLFVPMIIGGNDGSGVTNGVETAVVNTIADTSAIESYVFATPVTITIVYTDTGLTEAEELSLTLPYWKVSAQEWVDIAEECELAHTYDYHPEENYFTVQVCHLSRFGVAH